ncbi:MAG: ABC transporter ATP-binding protein [Clostridia bacterium]
MIKNVLKNLIKKRLVSIILLFVGIVAVVVLELAPSVILKNIVDTFLVDGYNFQSPISYAVLLSAAIYLSVILLSQGFEIVKQYMLMSIGQDASYEIKRQMIEKLSKIKTSYFSDNDIGVVLSRFTNDIDAVNTLFTDGIISMAIDLLKIVGVVITMFTFDYRLGLFTIVIIPFIFLITNVIKNRMRKSQNMSRKQIGMVNNHILETVRNHKIITIYGAEEYEKKRYDTYLKKNFNEMEKVNFFDSFYPPILQLMTALAVLFIITFSSGSLGFLNISIGNIAGAATLIVSLFTPIEKLGMELQTIQKAIAGAMRAQEFLDSPNDEKNENLKLSDIIKEKNEIKFSNVNFSYDGKKLILKNISFDLNELEMVSFIGETGVGKSTIFKLLSGEIQPTSGEITLNGITVASIPNELKSAIFGVVEQGFREVKGTIKDNICVKSGSASDERICDCLEMIGLLDVVKAFENGIDEKFDKRNFSEGQLELFSIARAIVLNPPILLFDEMTANLDSITEELILKALKKINSEHMVLSISHRMSSVMSSKKVIYLKDGEVEAIGTPNEVIEKNKHFKEQYILESSNWR